ncbi:zinc finger and BTB domain-containing protein 17-like isoform X1 [Varroa jacobsoni]|uniref:zinc finger and BTB domain-containing protein 17-like isoform X1 n=2 Tax=Varroa jacobsoni TaxID=62625 RepID=UPI000BF89040|nr:zinc finger and BTB domain-containing protein 17-like isoform X1 [Varroa jacobsoni]XP_022699025.1 zinc finger and BTB domain-containing protein 17-like isoform X1 [Varroa jacobsoni]
MGTHVAEKKRSPAMSQNDPDRIRENYEESVETVARMMDHIDSCYSFLDDKLYAQQIAGQISDPIGRYPNISLKNFHLVRSNQNKRKTGIGYLNRRRPGPVAKKESKQSTIADRQAEGSLEALRFSDIVFDQQVKTLSKRDNNNIFTVTPVSTMSRTSSAKQSERSLLGSAGSSEHKTVTKKNSSNSILSSLVVDVDDIKPTILPDIVTTTIKRIVLPPPIKKQTTQTSGLLSKFGETRCSTLPAVRDSSSTSQPSANATILKTPQASNNGSNSVNRTPPTQHLLVKPRPRRQASLRVSEFVRAEAALNGHDLDLHEIDESPSPNRVGADSAKGDIIGDETGEDHNVMRSNTDGLNNSDKAGVSNVDEDKSGSGVDIDCGDANPSSGNIGADRIDANALMDELQLSEDAPVQDNSEPTGFSCLYCDRTFIQAEAMENHIMDEHVYRSVATSKRPAKSIMPARSAGKPVSLNTPKASAATNRHDTVRPPPGKIITIESLVAAHFAAARKRTKSGRPQLCMVCKKTFSSWSQLKKHLPIHSSERPFKCPYNGCSYASVQKGNLKVHMVGVHVRRQEKMEAKMAKLDNSFEISQSSRGNCE